MKIELVPMPSTVHTIKPGPDFLMLDVRGPIDPAHQVLQRARELAAKSGNREMIEAVDASLLQADPFLAADE